MCVCVLPVAFRSEGCVGDENGKRTARSPSVRNHSTNCPSPEEERHCFSRSDSCINNMYETMHINYISTDF